MPCFRFDEGRAPTIVAHRGIGRIASERVRERIDASSINFVDLVVVPPGASIGRHRHQRNDEEVYVVIDGDGVMLIDGAERSVGPGDVLVNPPGGTHGLFNPGAKPIRLVVIDVSTDGSAYVPPDDLPD